MLDLFSKYLYLWGSLLGCLIFVLIYLSRKDLRDKMVKIGVFVGILGIFSEYFFFKDYWIPPLILKIGDLGGIEDFLFGFMAGGIGAAIYDVVFHKRLLRRGNHHYWIIPLVLFSEFLAMMIFSNNLGFNSIYASAIGFLVPAIIIVAVRRDLFLETIFSAVLVGGY